MKKRILGIFLLIAVFMNMLPISSFAADTISFDGIKEISKFGNIKFDSTVKAILDVFDYGDILTLSYGKKTVDLLLCKNYSDVDAGQSGFFVRYDGEDEALLAISSGNFAETYGVARKITNPDKSFYWDYFEGYSEKTEFTFTLKEKAGYLEEFTIRNIEYTDNRNDYLDLTDEQFANFRCVDCGKIAKNVLFRSATPVEPIHNRNTYADKSCADVGITHFINLAENETTLTSYEGYDKTYYASVNHIAVAANVDYLSDDTKTAFCEAFRYMAENKEIYDVHCREGKDRTGMFVAVLECLLGASYDEICKDYMITYYNYYSITKEDALYEIILNGSLVKTMNMIFDADIKKCNLQKEAFEYLKEIGMKNSEICALKINLLDKGIETLLCKVMYYVFRIIEKFDFNGKSESLSNPCGVWSNGDSIYVSDTDKFDFLKIFQ